MAVAAMVRALSPSAMSACPPAQQSATAAK
jgi:hypothetical protein